MKNIKIGENVIPVSRDGNTITVGDIVFEELEDFIYFVNKLTDIAEDISEEL